MKRNILAIGFVLCVLASTMTVGLEENEKQFIFLLGQDGQFKLKQPLVRFNHDKHTAMLKQNCAICHYANEETKKVCLLVKGSEKLNENKNAYHAVCLDCHKKEASKHDTIPVKCEQCHDKQFKKAHEPLKVLFRHSNHPNLIKDEVGCLKCHTKVNDKKLKEIHVCTSCHDDRDNKGVSQRKYGHVYCFQCHFKTAEELKNISCVLCHNIPPNAVFPTIVPEI
ncbi:cytochrome c3 family protein [candidate division CSSED10-310 bacterium]|uniref:Cytochrome c3 family protein n=1 Tax=candidate division CSSED10-310 bacterium TaxID=2855610 RepID=A0ABV6YYQ5_UNCC1